MLTPFSADLPLAFKNCFRIWLKKASSVVETGLFVEIGKFFPEIDGLFTRNGTIMH
ncbi:hypothetical protein AOR13_2704 [Alteromonas stellipolaris LMG 21856]|nr:hypothetical protein AOR13_2704 [Alteromonas stellipolaris LMG 21856]